MKKLPPVAFALFILALAGTASAVTDTYLTLNCGFSSPTHSISAKGTYYASNAPQCVAMTLVATLPNATKVTYSSTSCSSGVHDFVVETPVNGVYQLNATYSGSSASCSSAALFFQERPRLPEIHPALAVLVGLLSVALARKRNR